MVTRPDFEVKHFLVADQILEQDDDVRRDVRRVFDMPDNTTRISMQFMDATSLDLDTSGWNVRIRRFEGEGGFELTYKKRYRFDPDTVEQALARAAGDGFGADERDYDAQVEWGSDRRTLTLSRRRSFELSDYRDMDLPNEEDSRAIGADLIPGKLDGVLPVGWARSILSAAHVYGPVRGRRWTGDWDGGRICIEYWEVDRARDADQRRIVEISFKHAEEGEAGARRDRLQPFLLSHGWLRAGDVLKTKLILQSY